MTHKYERINKSIMNIIAAFEREIQIQEADAKFGFKVTYEHELTDALMDFASNNGFTKCEQCGAFDEVDGDVCTECAGESDGRCSSVEELKAFYNVK